MGWSAQSALVMALLYQDDDLFRKDRRVVGDVELVSQEHLEAVGSRWQLDDRLGLAAAEMAVLGITGNRSIQGGQFGVDEQVVVPRGVSGDPRRSNSHAL